MLSFSAHLTGLMLHKTNPEHSLRLLPVTVVFPLIQELITMRWRAKTLIYFRMNYAVFMSLSINNNK